MRERIAELREDLGWAIERRRRRIGQRPQPAGAEPPSRLRLALRRLTALGLLVLALVAVFRFVEVPGVPCEVLPAKDCVATDHAIELVPSESEVYVHLALDPEFTQFSQAQDLADRLPNFEAIAEGTLRTLGLPPGIELRRDLGSWIGDEAAFAQLSASQSLVLLAVGERKGAEGFLAGLGRGEPRLSAHEGVELRIYPNGIAGAQLAGFLVLGRAATVRAAIDAKKNRSKALSESVAVESIRDSLPEQRVGDAYLSKDGINRLLAGRGGVLAQLDTFADYGASRGLAAGLVADEQGLKLQLDSALEPKEARRAPSLFSAFPSFEPSLAGELAPDALLYVGIDDLAASVGALLGQARRSAPGLAAAFERFERVLRSGGVDITKDTLPVLDGEAAVGVASAGATPYLSLVFDGVDEKRAREEMAKLQVPIVAALRPERTGQAPTFAAQRIGGVVMRTVRLSATLNLAYAIFDGKLVIATNPAGVRQAVEGEDSLSESDSYESATSAAPGEVSALVFLNLEGLLRRAQPLGLDRIVGAFGADLVRLRALGVTVHSDEDNLETTFFLDIE